MQQENMKTLESLEDFRHFSEKELEIRFDQLKKQIIPADKTIREQAEKHWGHVAKPLGSLGVLEEDIVRAAAAQGEEVPDFSKRALLIFCADNGSQRRSITDRAGGYGGSCFEYDTREELFLPDGRKGRDRCVSDRYGNCL